MHNYTFSLPTKVIFGQGVVSDLSDELKNDHISKVLLLTGGKSVYASGLYDKVCHLLKEAGISFETVQGVQPNPRVQHAQEAADTARNMGAQAIIPIGGGSVFDSAKAVALGAVCAEPIWAAFERKSSVTGALPIYGILTLSGTSSEINKTSVITNEETHAKISLAHDVLTPRVSIVDPTLQYTVPLSQIMACGVDALSHVLEAYVMGFDTAEVIIEHCEAYAGAIIRCLKVMPESLTNYEVRSELAFCSVYAHSGWAGIGRPSRGDFSSHRIGHTLGGLFDITHGVTLALILPAWMRYMYDQGKQLDIFARMGRKLFGVTEAPGQDFALAGIEAFKAFLSSIGMPANMREVGITEADIPKMVQHTLPTLPFGEVEAMSAESIEKILRVAL